MRGVLRASIDSTIADSAREQAHLSVATRMHNLIRSQEWDEFLAECLGCERDDGPAQRSLLRDAWSTVCSECLRFIVYHGTYDTGGASLEDVAAWVETMAARNGLAAQGHERTLGLARDIVIKGLMNQGENPEIVGLRDGRLQSMLAPVLVEGVGPARHQRFKPTLAAVDYVYRSYGYERIYSIAFEAENARAKELIAHAEFGEALTSIHGIDRIIKQLRQNYEAVARDAAGTQSAGELYDYLGSLNEQMAEITSRSTLDELAATLRDYAEVGLAGMDLDAEEYEQKSHDLRRLMRAASEAEGGVRGLIAFRPEAEASLERLLASRRNVMLRAETISASEAMDEVFTCDDGIEILARALLHPLAAPRPDDRIFGWWSYLRALERAGEAGEGGDGLVDLAGADASGVDEDARSQAEVDEVTGRMLGVLASGERGEDGRVRVSIESWLDQLDEAYVAERWQSGALVIALHRLRDVDTLLEGEDVSGEGADGLRAARSAGLTHLGLEATGTGMVSRDAIGRDGRLLVSFGIEGGDLVAW